MTETVMPRDWRPPIDADWRRPHTLLRDVRVNRDGDADSLEKAAQDLRSSRVAASSIGIERYPDRAVAFSDRAELCRLLASRVKDEYRALQEGGSAGWFEQRLSVSTPEHRFN